MFRRGLHRFFFSPGCPIFLVGIVLVIMGVFVPGLRGCYGRCQLTLGRALLFWGCLLWQQPVAARILIFFGSAFLGIFPLQLQKYTYWYTTYFSFFSRLFPLFSPFSFISPSSIILLPAPSSAQSCLVCKAQKIMTNLRHLFWVRHRIYALCWGTVQGPPGLNFECCEKISTGTVQLTKTFTSKQIRGL